MTANTTDGTDPSAKWKLLVRRFAPLAALLALILTACTTAGMPESNPSA